MIERTCLKLSTHLLKLVGDGPWLVVPLEPHHIFSVKTPRLLLQCFSCQVLCLSALHVVKDEEERLSAEPLKELHRVVMRGLCLRVVRWRLGGITRQVVSRKKQK